MAFKKKVVSVTLPAHLSDLLQRWYTLQQELEQAKETEAKLRTLLVSALFDTGKAEGTETVEIGNGYRLQACKKMYYTATDTEGETRRLLSALPEGLRESLIDWKPQVSTSAYRELLASLPELPPQTAQLMSEAITVKPGMPTLSIIPPKPKGI